MPFTLSHAAAALPFRKLKPIWPALVIGTFAPDLQYFIWISDEDRSGHHFPDVLFVTVPLALALLWIFEWIVKGPALELLPDGLQRRLQDKSTLLSFLGWRRFFSILFWMAVGIATHLIWDSFTHSHTWVSNRWPVLYEKVSVPFLHPMSWLKILQHVSSIGGLAILIFWLGGWYLRTRPAARPATRAFSARTKFAAICAMVLVAAIGGYFYGNYLVDSHERPISSMFVLATILEAVILFFCIELVLYGLAFKIFARTHQITAPELDKTFH